MADEVAWSPVVGGGEAAEGFERRRVEFVQPLHQGEEDIAGKLGVGERAVVGGAAEAEGGADSGEGVAGKVGQQRGGQLVGVNQRIAAGEAGAAQEGGVEWHAVADERQIAEEGAQRGNDLGQRRGAAHARGSDARQALDAVGNGDAGRDERLEGVHRLVAGELDGADLHDGVLFSVQAGGLQIEGDTYGMRTHTLLPSISRRGWRNAYTPHDFTTNRVPAASRCTGR